MVNDEKVEFTVLGKVIGTGTGWDQMDTTSIIIYSFQPNAVGEQWLRQRVREDTDLCIDYGSGRIDLTGATEGDISGPLTVDWGVFNNVTVESKDKQ